MKDRSDDEFTFRECSNNPFRQKIRFARFTAVNRFSSFEPVIVDVTDQRGISFHNFRFCRLKSVEIPDSVVTGKYHIMFLDKQQFKITRLRKYTVNVDRDHGGTVVSPITISENGSPVIESTNIAGGSSSRGALPLRKSHEASMAKNAARPTTTKSSALPNAAKKKEDS